MWLWKALNKILEIEGDKKDLWAMVKLNLRIMLPGQYKNDILLILLLCVVQAGLSYLALFYHYVPKGYCLHYSFKFENRMSGD